MPGATNRGASSHSRDPGNPGSAARPRRPGQNGRSGGSGRLAKQRAYWSDGSPKRSHAGRYRNQLRFPEARKNDGSILTITNGFPAFETFARSCPSVSFINCLCGPLRHAHSEKRQGAHRPDHKNELERSDFDQTAPGARCHIAAIVGACSPANVTRSVPFPSFTLASKSNLGGRL